MSSSLSRVIGFAGITAAVVFGMSGCFAGDQNEHRDVSYGVTESVKTLVVKGDTGDIRVSGGGTGVQVTEHRSYQDQEPAATHVTADGTLTLTYSCPDHNCSVGYEVHVPAGTVVRVVNDTGSVRLAGLSAEVDARTGTGTVEATALTSGKVRLAAETGSVSARFAADPTMVYASSQTGSVRVQVPQGSAYAVKASTQTGSVQVGVRQEAGAARSIAATTETGSVTVADA